VRTRKISVIADPSGSKFAPWWPTPNQIIAFGAVDIAPHLYDFKTGQWSSVGRTINLDAWSPSLDRSSLYILTEETTLLRMRTPDFKVETIANLAGTRLTGEDTLSAVSSGQWMGIAADGSPVVTRDVGSSEVYALDVKWP